MDTGSLFLVLSNGRGIALGRKRGQATKAHERIKESVCKKKYVNLFVQFSARLTDFDLLIFMFALAKLPFMCPLAMR